MDNVYMQHYGYAWHKDARIPEGVDATEVGQELERLQCDGRIDTDNVIARAKMSESAMHTCFTWDVEKAAYKHWTEEARYIIRNIRPVVIPSDTEEETVLPQRVYVPVYTVTQNRDDAGIFQVQTILPTPEQDEIFEAGKKVLQRFADRYRDHRAFADIIAAIESL